MSRDLGTTPIFMPNIASLEVSVIIDGNVTSILSSAKELDEVILKNVCRIKLSAEFGKLPPMKRLHLGHSWPYQLEDDELLKVWDFSRLEDLCVDGIHFQHFFTNLPPSQFPALRKFAALQSSGSGLVVCQQLATFVKRLNSLDELKIAVHDPDVLSPAIAKHGGTLTHLWIGMPHAVMDWRTMKSSSLNVI